MMKNHSSPPEGLIVFKIDEQYFCFDIRYLTATLEPGELDSYQTDYLESRGAVDLHGQIFRLVDVAAFFDKKPGNRKTGRLLLIELGERRAALQVEQVTHVISLPSAKNSSLRFTAVENAEKLLGYYEMASRRMWSIDLEQVVAR